MTYIEKIKSIYPDLSNEDIIDLDCIEEIFKAYKGKVCDQLTDCNECWEQEYKNEKINKSVVDSLNILRGEQ